MKRRTDMDSPLVPSLAETRSGERAREILLVSYTIDEEHAPEFTETYDIAIGGLALLTNAELAKNSEIFIDLELRGDPRPKLRLHGSVRWSAYDPLRNKYRTGVSFTDRPTDFEQQLLGYIDTLHTLRDLGAL